MTIFRISDILNIGNSEMKTILMGKRGTVVIPVEIRRRLKLEEGSVLIVEEIEGRILLRPVPLPPPSSSMHSQNSSAKDSE